MDYYFILRYDSFMLLLILAAGALQKVDANEIYHITDLGTLKGKTQSVSFGGKFKSVTSFLGIPYAKPPICERRFARPERYGSLKSFGIYNALYYRSSCIQLATYLYMKHFSQNEDCLYLNIFVPEVPEPLINSHKYAVMIYIHGGSFAAGGADVYAGDILSAFNDVIVVTINYRLNVFGFLSNGDKTSGNFGLWDMKMAIEWVHDNIADYGGDPSRVTLFGNSAGGGAVLYQAINPDNRGLFHRVISQSGTCFAFWALQHNPVHNFYTYLNKTGCNLGSYSDQLACLRKLPTDKLFVSNTLFVPVVDNDFLLEDPLTLSKAQTDAGKKAMDFYSDLDLLIGVLSQDGAYAKGSWINAEENINGVSRSYFTEKFVPRMLHEVYHKFQSTLVTSFVIHQYTNWTAPNNTLLNRENVIDLESDVTFFIPAIHAAKTHARVVPNHDDSRNNTYFYLFDHKPDFAPIPDWLTGATHAMELPFIFGFTKALEIKMTMDYEAVDPFVTSQQDIQFSYQLMTYWTNFVKSG
jgi:carboxylesterase type B